MPSNLQNCEISKPLSFFFMAALGFELSTSHLLDRHCYCLTHSVGIYLSFSFPSFLPFFPPSFLSPFLPLSISPSLPSLYSLSPGTQLVFFFFFFFAVLGEIGSRELFVRAAFEL
jgi:hypothetical protein